MNAMNLPENIIVGVVNVNGTYQIGCKMGDDPGYTISLKTARTAIENTTWGTDDHALKFKAALREAIDNLDEIAAGRLEAIDAKKIADTTAAVLTQPDPEHRFK